MPKADLLLQRFLLAGRQALRVQAVACNCHQRDLSTYRTGFNHG